MSGLSALCVLLALATGSASPPARAATVRPQQVRVVHYSPNVMRHVVKVRIRQGYPMRADVDGYVSRPSCKTIGQIVYLSVNGGAVRRYQQADCSAPKDRARHMAQNIVEIDFTSARVTGLVADGHGRGLLWGK